MKKKSAAPKNYIGEWFGYRVYPEVKCGDVPATEFTSKKCPFLSASTGTIRECVKNDNSKGVCTITTTTGKTQDWMVCPYRSLDDAILTDAIGRIFSVAPNSVEAFPVTRLSESNFIADAKQKQAAGKNVFIYFQQKLGGEINISATPQTPELSFDLTIMPISFRDDTLLVRKYGLYEVQTMDFHGSYSHAVKAVRNALDLHADSFADAIKNNTDWLGRGIEGPNIANVFKRTFYQILLKFGLSGHADCAGVVLALPSSVWDSWGPHLAAPVLSRSKDIYALKGDKTRKSKSWILVYSNNTAVPAAIEPLMVRKVIRASVDALLKSAFRDVPKLISQQSAEIVRTQIVSRIAEYYSNVEYDA